MSSSDSGSAASSSDSVIALGGSQVPPPTHRRPSSHSTSLPRNDGHPLRYASHQSSSSVARSSNSTHTPLSPHERYASSSISTEARRESMIAMDRKRRLTASNYIHEPLRRRHNPSDFFTRSESLESNDPNRSRSSASPPVPPPGDASNQSQVVDLTGSPSPPATPPRPNPRHSLPRRTSSSSSRRYVVPPWQPDSEVSQCPICKRYFTWMFRRHHCRKCGRVVCDSCSPHRITIPRPFIVNPPRPDTASSQDQVETIDLTADDTQDDQDQDRRRSRYLSMASLEGGEKVRLCNPCVPDPQPEPLPNYPTYPEDANSSPFGLRPPGTSYHQPAPMYTNILGQPRRIHHVRNFPQHNSSFEYLHQQTSLSQSHGGMPASRLDYSSSLGSRPRPPSITNPYSVHFPDPNPRHSSALAGASGAFAAGRGHDVGVGDSFTDLLDTDASLQTSLQQIAGLSHYPNAVHGHNRYASLDVHSRPQPPFPGRPRGSTMFDLDRGHGIASSSSHARSPGQGPSRPRLHERDICPVCRRALPPRGENGDESVREAHIMACISSRDPSTALDVDGGSPSRTRIYTHAFIATEKDCTDGNGNAQECSICMEDFELGAELAVLECWCKFHKTCIASWLGRKAECPVHKASRFNI